MQNWPGSTQVDTKRHYCESHCFQQIPASVFHTAPLVYGVDKLCFLSLFSLFIGFSPEVSVEGKEVVVSV